MTYLYWGLIAIAAAWSFSKAARVIVGLFAPLGVVGSTYLDTRLSALGVPLGLMTTEVRVAVVSDCEGISRWKQGRLEQRNAFREAIDLTALQYAMWLKDPESRLPGESPDGKYRSGIRAVFGTPLRVPESVRTGILR